MGKLSLYLPRQYVSPIGFKALVAFELPVTIALLALFGIASPNLYRTKLWQDGAENGFNSSPQMMVYEFANYRPYEIPDVWDQFITSFNLVISVLSTFFLLVKSPMFLMNVFYPPLSILIHVTLLVLYCVSAAYQGGKDMADSEHPQPGAPWYITKNCNVALKSENVGYCQQAKSAFACTIIIIIIFTAQLVLAVLSCLPNDDARAKEEERRERHEALEELRSLKSPVYATHGFDSVMTPRTSAFNQLNGTMDLPFRHPSSTLNNSQNSTPDLKDVKDVKDVDAIEVVPPVPPVPQFHQEQFAPAQEPQYAPELQHLRQAHPQPEPQQQPQPHPEQQPQTQTQPAMYFPPPPRKASKSKK